MDLKWSKNISFPFEKLPDNKTSNLTRYPILSFYGLEKPYTRFSFQQAYHVLRKYIQTLIVHFGTRDKRLPKFIKY